MARRTQTCAIRLAVEGGGQVKAELVSVGQSGEQSLKRIETRCSALAYSFSLPNAAKTKTSGTGVSSADGSPRAGNVLYRWGWGFSTSQDFNGDIALIACFAFSWTPSMARRWHADPFGFLRPWNELPALLGSLPPAVSIRFRLCSPLWPTVTSSALTWPPPWTAKRMA